MDFFKTRFYMHSSVYTHKTVKAIEFMVVDALVQADNHMPISDGKGGLTKISQAMVRSRRSMTREPKPTTMSVRARACICEMHRKKKMNE